MVVIFCAAVTPLTGRMQERTGLPSMCTVQAPHCAKPQPYFEPVNPICSRRAQSRGVLGSTSMSLVTPLTFNRTMVGGSGKIELGCATLAEYSRPRGQATVAGGKR